MEKFDNVTGDCILHFITSHRVTNIFDQLVTSLMMKWYCIASFETPTETYLKLKKHDFDSAKKAWKVLKITDALNTNIQNIQNLLMKMYTNCIWNGQNCCNCVSHIKLKTGGSTPVLVPNLRTRMNIAGRRPGDTGHTVQYSTVQAGWHGSHCN